MRLQAALMALAVVVAGSVASAETTRTVEGELAVPAGPFVVENLAGDMKVLPGDGERVTVKAIVHAESESLAAEMKLEEVRGEKGEPTLRVVYPLGFTAAVRYPGSHGSSRVTYADRKVRVSGSSGKLLWAEVEVRVPRRAVEATFRNLVGTLRAEGVKGQLLLDAASGDITARQLEGRIKGDTGSGDVTAEDVKGSFTCDTGSGRCVVRGLEGDELVCDTGSGDVDVSQVRATSIKADTGSGDVEVRGSDAEELLGDTGSGNVGFEVTGSRLRRVVADTGSGDVRLKVPANTTFELRADQGSGELECAFTDAQAIVHHREVVGYRRGDGRVRIDVNTGSGSVSISPQ